MEMPSALLKLAKAHWQAGRLETAMHEAWAAYRLDRTDITAKEFLTGFLNRNPTLLDPRKRPWNVDSGTRSDLVGLLKDRQVDPDRVATAGWGVLLGDAVWAAANESGKTDALAAYLESDELCQTLSGATIRHLSQRFATDRHRARSARHLICVSASMHTETQQRDASRDLAIRLNRKES